MNYARKQTRWAFSKEQFFEGEPTYMPYWFLAMGAIGFIAPLVSQAPPWLELFKVLFTILVMVHYIRYYAYRLTYQCATNLRRLI